MYFVKSSRGHSHNSRNFSYAPIYCAHLAVVFAIAQLSCSTFSPWFSSGPNQQYLLSSFCMWLCSIISMQWLQVQMR